MMNFGHLRIYGENLRALSFLLMCMVVFIHSQCYGPFIESSHADHSMYILRFCELLVSEGVCRVAVPLFFLLSGCFILNRFTQKTAWYFEKIKTRFRSLVIPFVLWSSLSFVLYFTFQNLPLTKDMFSKNIITDMSMFQIIKKVFWNSYCYQLWFIRDLFVFVLLLPVIIKIACRKYCFVYFIMFYLFIFGRPLLVSSEGLFFFSIGVLFVKNNFCLPSLPFNSKWLLFLWGGLVTARACLCIVADQKFTTEGQFIITIGVFAVFYNLKYLTNWLIKHLAVCKYTFFLYVFHEPMLSMIKKSYLSFCASNEALRIIMYFMAPVFIVVVSLFFANTMQKKTLSIYKIVTGGR